MSYKNGKATCDGWCGGAGEITHIDDKGFIYCAPCGERRKGSGQRCRKLRTHEITKIQRGEPLARY